MSDWGPEPTPNPTIVLDYLWDRPVGYCGNCYEQVDMQARSHWGGCNIVYQFVTTRDTRKTWEDKAAGLRPDLQFVRQNVQLPEHTPEFLKSMPVRPLQPWELAEPSGEGRAGNYLRHLRSERKGPSLKDLAAQYMSVDPGHTRTGVAMDFGPTGDLTFRDFLKRRGLSMLLYGTRAPFTTPKEDTTMKIDITISADSPADLIRAVLDLSEYDGVTVSNFRNIKEPEFRYKPPVGRFDPALVTTRSAAVDQAAITRMVQEAADYNSSDPVSEVELEIEYKAQGTEEVSRRRILPIKVSDDGKVTLVDLDLDTGQTKGVKTFFLDRIQRANKRGS